MRILLTNHRLGARAGSELYIRDLAVSLLKRGHTPIVYSTQHGEVARELRAATVPVVKHLDALASPPDLIHGQHHVETMTALLHFPNAPAVFFCHGWLPWEETPPRFPRILRYVAVDDTCRDRLVHEHAIAEERARVILNFVDLEKFLPRSPLPLRPQRALIFSNYAGEHNYTGVVREACARMGIALDVVGRKAGNASPQPEKLLGHYDLVFAKARCALEALAVGTAVVLCDEAGAGPLVTTAELERLRRFNFGIRALQESLEASVLEREIARYDSSDAAEVSRRIRATAGREAAVDEILVLYEEVLAEHAALRTSDTAAESRAASAYLRWLSIDLSRRTETLSHSTVFRLRNRLLRVPLLGRLARAVARKAAGSTAR